jgi:hypothetical protein
VAFRGHVLDGLDGVQHYPSNPSSLSRRAVRAGHGVVRPARRLGRVRPGRDGFTRGAGTGSDRPSGGVPMVAANR